MRLPQGNTEYERRVNAVHELEDYRNQKNDEDIELASRTLYISDSNGTRYALTMGTDGVLTTTIQPASGRAFDTGFNVGYG